VRFLFIQKANAAFGLLSSSPKAASFCSLPVGGLKLLTTIVAGSLSETVISFIQQPLIPLS